MSNAIRTGSNLLFHLIDQFTVMQLHGNMGGENDNISFMSPIMHTISQQETVFISFALHQETTSLVMASIRHRHPFRMKILDFLKGCGVFIDDGVSVHNTIVE